MAFGSFSKMLEKMLPPHSSKAIEAPNLDAKDDPWHRPFVLQMPQHPQAALKHDPGHKTLVLTPRPKNEVILSATLDGQVDLQDEQKVLDSFGRAASCKLASSFVSLLEAAGRGTPVDSRQDYAPDYSHTSERRCANYASKADGETAGGSAVDSLQGSRTVPMALSPANVFTHATSHEVKVFVDGSEELKGIVGGRSMGLGRRIGRGVEEYGEEEVSEGKGESEG
ncbi:hypothetical protein Slin15195_G111370 [Septoria linicola]|uniref:Uncharacterized protein n=1 Tax=Septoria linicola TaxID=215465 RepID=A0A9Q9B2N4_9PEZI|nr:hypothetical protein Slin15195_G111370 [Septoria linicola]